MTKLTVEGASVVLGSRIILSDITLSLPQGQLTVIIGPNGAGKSTLLRLLSGELPPSAGRVVLDGKVLASLPPRELAARRSVMPQAVQLAFPFLVEEVVGLGAFVPSFPSELALHAIVDAMHLADVSSLQGRFYTELSGGERQRVQFARALCQLIAARTAPDQTFLLLDEPTSNLDLPHQMLLLKRAREEASRGRTVVAVLHDLNLASAWADCIVALSKGKLAGAGAPASILTDDLLTDVYECPISVTHWPEGNLPLVLPHALQQHLAFSR